jgi:hypothetical protein
MPNNTQNRLTRAVKRILDVLRVLAIVSLILWPLAVVVMTIGQSSHPESWGVDINVYSGFTIDLDKFETDIAESVGVRDPIIDGKAALSIDTSSPTALYVFTLITELGGVVALYVLLQLRALFASLVGGMNFAPENSGRIKKIGFVIIAWSLVNPILQYFGGQVILNEYSLSVPGIQLNPAFEISGTAILIGVAMIILSGVLNEATRIHDDQQLTI